MKEVTRTCRTCSSSFTLSADEVKWYKKKNFSLPSTCFKCRKFARIGKRGHEKTSKPVEPSKQRKRQKDFWDNYRKQNSQ